MRRNPSRDTHTAVSKTKGRNEVPERRGLQTGRSGSTPQRAEPNNSDSSALAAVPPEGEAHPVSPGVLSEERGHQGALPPNAGPEQALVGSTEGLKTTLLTTGNNALPTCVCGINPTATLTPTK